MLYCFSQAHCVPSLDAIRLSGIPNASAWLPKRKSTSKFTISTVDLYMRVSYSILGQKPAINSFSVLFNQSNGPRSSLKSAAIARFMGFLNSLTTCFNVARGRRAEMRLGSEAVTATARSCTSGDGATRALNEGSSSLPASPFAPLMWGPRIAIAHIASPASPRLPETTQEAGSS
jgi:hypothetical protein